MSEEEYYDCESIAEIIQDTLHYPELARAYNALDKFQIDDLLTAFQEVIDKASEQYVDDVRSEIQTEIYNNAFEEGKKAGMQITVKEIRNKLDDFKISMNIKT